MAREACGWTQEQMADALGVLPAEVAVWESGAVAIPAEMQGWMRYEAKHALHLRRLREAGAPECRWLDDNRAGQAAIGAEGGMAAWNRAWVRHQRACPECRRAKEVVRTLPPPPDPPLPWPQAVFRRVRRLPWPLRVPTVTALGAGISATVLLPASVYSLVKDPSGGFLFPLTAFLAGTVGITAWTVANDRLGSRNHTHPVAATYLQTAAVAAAVNAVLLARFPAVSVAEPGGWWLYAGTVLGIGWILSRGAKDRVDDLTAKPTRS